MAHIKYAMILQNRVVEFVTEELPPEWGPDSDGNLVTAVPCDDTVTIGMGYNEKIGEFGEYIPKLPTPIPEPPPPTDTELIMQALSDTELRDIEAQGERELLAQQMTDMELLLMEGGGMV